MATYANQKTFTIHRDKVEQRGDKQYLIIYSDRLDEASRSLCPVGLKLYLYLITNKDGYNKDFSPRHFANVYGVSIDSAYKATQNLIDNGYLKFSGGNHYDFYETPQIESPHIAVETETRLMRQTDGTYLEMSYAQVYEELKGALPLERIDSIWNAAKEVK